MKKEADDTTMDSMYETDTSSVVQPANAKPRTKDGMLVNRPPTSRDQPKKAKKSLESSWNNSDLPYIIETPVSLIYNCLYLHSN